MALTNKGIKRKFRMEEILSLAPKGYSVDNKIALGKVLEKMSMRDLNVLYFFVASVDEPEVIKRQLWQMTESDARKICTMIGEPFISLVTNHDRKWKDIGLEVQITTTCTTQGSKDDSCIWIKSDGTVRLHRNNGQFNGSRDVPVNAMLITDFLKKQGYVFNT